MTVPLATTNAAPGQFDFGLNAAEESRAARLHRESIVVDLVSQHAGGTDWPLQAPDQALKETLGAVRPVAKALEFEIHAAA